MNSYHHPWGVHFASVLASESSVQKKRIIGSRSCSEQAAEPRWVRGWFWRTCSCLFFHPSSVACLRSAGGQCFNYKLQQRLSDQLLARSFLLSAPGNREKAEGQDERGAALKLSLWVQAHLLWERSAVGPFTHTLISWHSWNTPCVSSCWGLLPVAFEAQPWCSNTLKTRSRWTPDRMERPKANGLTEEPGCHTHAHARGHPLTTLTPQPSLLPTRGAPRLMGTPNGATASLGASTNYRQSQKYKTKWYCSRDSL